MYITYFKYTNYPKRSIQKTKELLAIKNIVAKKESRHNEERKLNINFSGTGDILIQVHTKV